MVGYSKISKTVSQKVSPAWRSLLPEGTTASSSFPVSVQLETYLLEISHCVTGMNAEAPAV